MTGRWLSRTFTSVAEEPERGRFRCVLVFSFSKFAFIVRLINNVILADVCWFCSRVF